MPIRVLHILPSLNKGSGLSRFVMNHWSQLAEDVTFSFVVHKRMPNDFVEYIRSKGGIVYELPWPSIKNFAEFCRLLEGLYAECSKSVDVVHCHSINLSCFHFFYAKKYGINRRILHAHTIESSPIVSHRLRNAVINPYGIRLATHLLACTEEAGRKTFKGREFRVLYNAIDLTRFHPDEELRRNERISLGVGEKTIVVGCIGRLSAGKNIDRAINIFRVYKTTCSDSKLIIAGEGSLKQQLQEMVTRAGLEESVLFLGHIDDLVPIYNSMDVFLLPSRAEGFGLVAIEAQACGVPCVLSDGVPRIVDATGLCHFVSLEAPDNEWAETIKKSYTCASGVSAKPLNDGPFDIAASSKLLFAYYRQAAMG